MAAASAAAAADGPIRPLGGRDAITNRLPLFFFIMIIIFYFFVFYSFPYPGHRYVFYNVRVSGAESAVKTPRLSVENNANAFVIIKQIENSVFFFSYPSPPLVIITIVLYLFAPIGRVESESFSRAIESLA